MTLQKGEIQASASFSRRFFCGLIQTIRMTAAAYTVKLCSEQQGNPKSKFTRIKNNGAFFSVLESTS
jgi:hypothetical protein